MNNISLQDFESASEADLDSLVARFTSLPISYLQFISQHNGAYCRARLSPEDTPENLKFPPSVERFLKAEDVVVTAENIEDFPEKFAPIANDGCGGFTCISCEEQKIYYWDPDWAEFHLTALSFEDWLEKLEPV